MKRLREASGIAARAWAILAGLAVLALLPFVMLKGAAVLALRSSNEQSGEEKRKGLFRTLQRLEALLPNLLVRLHAEAGTFSIRSASGPGDPSVVPPEGLAEYLRNHARAGSRVAVVMPSTERKDSPSYSALLRILRDECALQGLECQEITSGAHPSPVGP